MSSKPVVLYGASGYTGRLIAEFLREYEIPFVAAGRNREKIEAALDSDGGLQLERYDLRRRSGRLELDLHVIGDHELARDSTQKVADLAKAHFAESVKTRIALQLRFEAE